MVVIFRLGGIIHFPNFTETVFHSEEIGDVR